MEPPLPKDPTVKHLNDGNCEITWLYRQNPTLQEVNDWAEKVFPNAPDKWILIQPGIISFSITKKQGLVIHYPYRSTIYFVDNGSLRELNFAADPSFPGLKRNQILVKGQYVSITLAAK